MSAPVWRKGRLLVASPSLNDPNFHRTVVLMLEHSDEGALGVVLNRPTTLRSHDALPEHLAAALDPEDLIHEGGPVEPENVILLGDFTDPSALGELAIGSIGVVEPDSDFSTLAGKVRALRAFGGYAGWSPGQLESEIDDEAWIDSECRPSDVFSDDPSSLWEVVLDRKGGNYRLVARMPLDPNLN